MQYSMPVVVGVVYVLLMSLVREPHRRPLNALLIGGAGGTYLSADGLGAWELVFSALMVYVAYRGLRSWAWIRTRTRTRTGTGTGTGTGHNDSAFYP
ncbi:DUF6010 family protein [Streptomyces sp. NPDC057877]|uniref:DUF6010 family protein n=1 Tax=Streptomyces sp. NPDC057877 TaxID=3346269 RepID=UPI0036CD4606